MEQVLARPIETMQEHRAIGLIPTKDGSALSGVLMIDMRTGGFRFVRAKAVLMATGGGPTMYKYHTPSGDKTMDGLAMALRAGLPLRDMEMVQFHPTGLLAGDHAMTGTVLEEGLRGAGGQLLNGAGHRFMFDYDPRASARRATWSAAASTPRCASRTPRRMAACSYLDGASGAGDCAQEIQAGMVKRCADCGFDLAAGGRGGADRALLHGRRGGGPRHPHRARRALCGGRGCRRRAWLEPAGRQRVANSTVYGGVAGDTMGADIQSMPTLREPDEDALEVEIARATYPHRHKPDLILPLRKQLQDLMWEEVGVMRTEAGMTRGLAGIAEVSDALMNVGVDDANLAFNLTWHDWLQALPERTRAVHTTAKISPSRVPWRIASSRSPG
jgi:fumarate reductase flavoprotein subunit